MSQLILFIYLIIYLQFNRIVIESDCTNILMLVKGGFEKLMKGATIA
jgi:hypothetical protein